MNNTGRINYVKSPEYAMISSPMELSLIQEFHRLSIQHFGKSWIGDDCCSVDLNSSHLSLIVTKDVLIDQVHFSSRDQSLYDIARKSVLVNLSDLIAGGADKFIGILVGLVIPSTWTKNSQHLMETFSPFLNGLFETCSQFQAPVLGGDTNVSSGPLVISITALGQSHWRGPTTRKGAKDNDIVWVSGPLGGSLRFGRHLNPNLRLHEAKRILDQAFPNAMMDISDGLASDLRTLARCSEKVIMCDPALIPIHNDVAADSFEERLRHAFCDGEDFELLGCHAEVDFLALQKQWPKHLAPLIPIGRVQNPTSTQRVGEIFWSSSLDQRSLDGKLVSVQQLEPIEWKGYEHGQLK